ncbi:MAG TPA: hypothetical protein VJ729_15125 [Nitrososphaeraceae archaeon]|nr:hypothetical protein [Nitrososphaeraceae archaeon]
MKIGQVIVIISLSVASAGILHVTMSGMTASHPLVSQKMLVVNDIIKSKEIKNSILNVLNNGPTMYLIIKADPPNIPISAIVKDPHGSIVSSSAFSQDLVANFKPEIRGKYNLILMNQGTTDVRFNSILGYLPLFGENASPNYDALAGILFGTLLIALGCFGLALGIFITIKNVSSHEFFNDTYMFLKTLGKKFVACFSIASFSKRKHSTTIRRDLIMERLSELEKQKNDFIADPGHEE